MNYKTNKRNSIELSIKDKNYDGEKNYQFSEVKDIPVNSLEKYFKGHNYSPIQWRNNYRTGDNFISASGFMIDIDTGMTIKEAEEVLQQHKLNYALITSKSHSEELHKFHILLPFNRKVYTTENYKAVATRIRKELFPSLDPNTMDAARYMYGSHQSSIYKSCFTSNAFEVDLEEHVSNAWKDDFVVKLKNGDNQTAVDLDTSNNKTVPIYCPFHRDGNPSAFVAYSEKSINHYIRCTSCNRTYWKVQTKDVIGIKCENFWSVGTSIYEAGIVNDTFSLENIAEKKFYVKAGANKENKELYYAYVVNNKHIHRISTISHIGDATIDESSFSCDASAGLITVNLKPLPINITDNDFIENYLEATFGKYKGFIKQWLAVYVYTNYRKLPTIILTGDRGTGKNTFAESIQAIYPTISEVAKDLDGNFTPFAEKKLLIIDESDSNGKLQYQLLKKFSGQKYMEVNKKYLPQYQVRNNLNIIFLSNNELPIYVERDEMPTDDSNNQFFVYRMKPHAGCDATLQDKIIDRLGYYIRTELKTVFEGLILDNYRYAVSVPITDEEKKLFNNSITDIEAEADRVIEVFESRLNDTGWTYYKHVQKGVIPTDFFHDVINNYPGRKIKVIQNLQKRKLLTNDKVDKVMVDKKRPYCYKLGEVWLNMVKTTTQITPEPATFNSKMGINQYNLMI